MTPSMIQYRQLQVTAAVSLPSINCYNKYIKGLPLIVDFKKGLHVQKDLKQEQKFNVVNIYEVRNAGSPLLKKKGSRLLLKREMCTTFGT
jgi:hypothetical protein